MLYGCADEALYAAKHNGRDRIESRPLSGKRRTA
jgi:PleD family two-component response regulator